MEPSFVHTVDPIRMLVFSLAPSSVKLTMAGFVEFCPTIKLVVFPTKRLQVRIYSVNVVGNFGVITFEQDKMSYEGAGSLGGLYLPGIWGLRKESRLRNRQSITISPLRFENLMTSLIRIW